MRQYCWSVGIPVMQMFHVCVWLFQHKMDEHMANVRDFQSMMLTHSDWISTAEQTVAAFKHPSKLVDRVLQQIQQHKV